MTDPHEDRREEEQLALLLSAANRDLPPPDRELLARLREQSAAVVSQPAANVDVPHPPRTERTRMWILRASILTIATAVLIALYLAPPPSPADVPFREVMEKLNSAQTLQIRQRAVGPRSNGFTSVSWVRQPRQWRADIVSQIEQGTTLVTDGRRWRIDEAANQATSKPVSFGKSVPVEMFLFAGDPQGPHWQKFLRQRPVERYEREGVEIAVYHYHHADSELGSGCEFHAEVNAKTGLLRFLNSRLGSQGGYQTELLAFNEPVPDEKFAVKETLTEDGRIGKVTDSQGIVAIKPVLEARWTPVCGQLLLKPGDWLRTDVRGANAVGLQLMKQTDVILGPGSLAEFKSPTEIRLHYGEIEVTAPEKPAVQLVAANQEPITLKGRGLYRLKDDKLVRVEKDPPWLAGFKGVRPQESIGSLVANIDGRNTPLTVGYHKVTVDIRDQIARTVIEESFVNHTKNTLEGVFHFPLPQDASISGFGMWIGDELVEADVVEKQRAREIYETILRERRDPGLLEWSGGNLFKARVFPIFGRSEKRIKITYTQVLPLKGNNYRYSYALQSELLKQHPLRELSINVKLASVLPLKQISCPTHPARIDRTEHAAHVEFAAQEHTPTRDFEVLIETLGQQDVAVIPHRRGDDGYFMLLLHPPAAGGAWQRELLPKTEPLKLLLLADTSASLDQPQRTQQADFVAAVCSSLTAEDTVNLACADVTCDWAFEKPQPADDKNIARLREHLAARRSLGWTDLDKAFASALAMSQRGQAHFAPKASQNEPVPDDTTHVIYIGDGSATTGDADPQAFVKRLTKLHAGKAAALHAVGIGNTFEPAVLRGIAAQGGGSMRQISGEQTPQRVALELLGELAQPGLRDIELEFHGLRVARVYPERLPNLPAGSQQLVLGRYLPEGRDQQGEVVVTARQGDKEVRFRTAVALKDAEEGNSFIPRLWARMHLDTLLEQGSSEAIREEIIGLSEEYHIITPYTSLLVLESDEDRQRFKVQRRFQMRDGEKFFQEGRDQAQFALMQQQMQRAAAWRLELRRGVLAELARAGRDPRTFQPRRYDYDDKFAYFGRSSGMSNRRRGLAGGLGGGGGELNEWFFGDEMADIGRPMLSSGPVDSLSRLSADYDMPDQNRMLGLSEDSISSTDWDSDGSQALGQEEQMLDEQKHKLQKSLSDRRELSSFDPQEIDELSVWLNLSSGLMAASGPRAAALYDFAESAEVLAADKPMGGRLRRSSRGDSQEYTRWLDELFPTVPAAPKKPREPDAELWPKAARDLADSLLRTTKLGVIEGGLELNRTWQSFDLRFNELSSQSQQRELVSPKAWLVRSGGVTSQTLVQWCDDRTRGIYSEAFQLGRQRASTSADLQSAPLGLGDFSLSPLYASHGSYKAEVRPEAEGRQRLVLITPHNAEYRFHYVIDTARNVVVAVESHVKGELTATTKFSDFVELGGMWWAKTVESFDKQGRRNSLVTQTIAPLAAEPFSQRMQQELASRDAVQLIPQPLPSLSQAKAAAAAGKATFAEQLTLVLHFARSQQWPRVDEHLAACEKLAAAKPGVRWMRLSLFSVSRRHEELRKLLAAEAGQLVPPPADQRLIANEYAIAERVLNLARNVQEAREVLELMRKLRPVYDRQPAWSQVLKEWRRQEAYQVYATGQSEEAIVLYEKLARDYPRDVNAQREYAQQLANRGEYPAAYAWLERVLTGPIAWEEYEEGSLREAYAQLLQNQGRYEDLVKYLAAWVERKPQSSSAYQQYLSALLRSDQIDVATRVMQQWLRESREEGELPPDVVQKLYAAVQQALGQGYHIYTNRVEPEWEEPLAEIALYFARHAFQASTAETIMGSSAFHATDACRRVRREAIKWLLDDAELAKLKPAEIARFVSWVLPNDPALTPVQWQELATQIEKRWSDEKDADERHRLGQSLVQVLSQRIGVGPHLAFLRRQLNDGPQKHRATYASQLFDALLAQPWSDEHERESLALIKRLSAVDDATRRLIVEIAALYRWTDRMVAARSEAGVKAIEKPENLTRTQLREKQQEILKQARQGVADLLAQEAGKQERPWTDWLTIERLYLDLLAGRELAKIESAGWEAVGAKPQAGANADEVEPAGAILASILQERYLATLANLALRSTATPALRERLLKYVDQGLSVDDDDADYWREWKYRLLVGFDQPQTLATELQTWMRDDPLHRWRQALGYLLAEQGSLEAAVKLFEGVELADELGPDAYRTLADWYLALNRREEHEQAMIRSFGTIEEWQLNQYLSNKLQLWRGGNRPPSELDQQVLLVFRALFAKSGSPQSYEYQLREFYRATRDFRLLGVLADSVLGHTAGKVYPFLQQLKPVLDEIRDEATADSLVERIAQVRARAKTPVDGRALDLLEALVERRAAELLNQPGPHVERALAALQRSFEREWTAGEPRLLADLLGSLGRITQPKLAAEQLRQLEALDRRQGESDLDRLLIAHRLATAYWDYERFGAAIDRLEAALRDHVQASGGLLISTANEPFSTLVRFHEERKQFIRGEKLIEAQLARPANRQQEQWLIVRRFELYRESIRSAGETSLGSGVAQFTAVTRAMQKALEAADPEHRYQLIERLCQIYTAAQREAKLAGVQEDLQAFAFQRLPPLLAGQTNHYGTITSRVAHTLHDLAGVRLGLKFLIERLEQEPAWLRYSNQDVWSQHGHTLGQWRNELNNLGDLEPRLLAIVLKELRRDLATRNYRNRNLYHRHYGGHYWAEKADAFAREAEAVLARHKDSAESVKYIARYFDEGLDRTARAAGVLQEALTRGVLDEAGTFQLVSYLHRLERYQESIALLEPLMEKQPENLEYRAHLMRAYFKTNRPEQLVKLLDQTDAFFHQNNRWSEGVLAQLAASCLENELYERSVTYYKELIPLHERTQPGRGIGRGTLSGYYGHLARAHAGLKQTAEAVEAACGAIIAWGPRHENRQHALNTLTQVLRDAPDLDGYVGQLDRQAAESGLHNPLVRKSLGQVYKERQQPARAIVQLKLALELQPTDAQTHELLLAAYDAAGNREGAIDSLFEAVQLRRRDLKLYQSLGERLATLERSQESERAYASIVEMQPLESESHTLLAEIRQQQNRWPESIEHWRRVSEIRALEPTGLLKLAEAQLHEKQWNDATATLVKLRQRAWPERFGNIDSQVRQFEQRIQRERK